MDQALEVLRGVGEDLDALGHTLKIAGSPHRRTGKRYPTYHCHGRYASGLCPARASIVAAKLDGYVEEQVLAALRAEDGFLAEAVEASEQIEEAARRVEAAEHERELELFDTDPQMLSVLGRETFLRGVDARQQAVEAAREELARVRSQSALTSELTSGDLLQAWETFTPQEKRQLLHGLLDRVVVKRDPNSRAKALALSVSERTQIVLKGNVLLGPSPDDLEPESSDRR